MSRPPDAPRSPGPAWRRWWSNRHLGWALLSVAFGGAFVIGLVIGQSGAGRDAADHRPNDSVEANSAPSGPGFTESLFVDLLVTETNDERRAEGLGPLELSEVLSDSAGFKLDHMVRHDYWAHHSPDGRTPWFFFDAIAYDYVWAGENLASSYATPSGVVQGWLQSPEHRAVMLDPSFLHIGVAVRYLEHGVAGRSPGWLVVAHYAKPR